MKLQEAAAAEKVWSARSEREAEDQEEPDDADAGRIPSEGRSTEVALAVLHPVDGHRRRDGVLLPGGSRLSMMELHANLPLADPRTHMADLKSEL